MERGKYISACFIVRKGKHNNIFHWNGNKRCWAVVLSPLFNSRFYTCDFLISISHRPEVRESGLCSVHKYPKVNLKVLKLLCFPGSAGYPIYLRCIYCQRLHCFLPLPVLHTQYLAKLNLNAVHLVVDCLFLDGQMDGKQFKLPLMARPWFSPQWPSTLIATQSSQGCLKMWMSISH